ncbi:uncharacterized protein LOC132785543 [Drosophila nasuta]|uniref:uncharacterized protein LOC132785543 n=1 Tax=Drosophila nasuta TaxID=42062 RepID=UPI00295EBC1F|nr:uncharacterized protein LOC132785543 [Drosophila nasuta]
MSRHSRFLRTKTVRSNPSYKRYLSSKGSKVDVPPIDYNISFWFYTNRHSLDSQHVDRFYDEYETIDFTKRKEKEFYDDISQDPTYSKFKVPFQMICQERYSDSIKRYDQQFSHEIRNIIDNQSTAREACYFVRTVAYTTLWPPYHNEKELDHSSRLFYALTPEEKARFQYIMSNDFSYT